MNGSIEVWDLLERTNEPAMVQNISSTAITNIQLKVITTRQHLLAISDASGTVHILQVPYILRVPNQSNELQSVESYFNREVDRIQYFSNCLDTRGPATEAKSDKELKKEENENAKPSAEEEAEKVTKYFEKYGKFVQGIAPQFGVSLDKNK